MMEWTDYTVSACARCDVDKTAENNRGNQFKHLAPLTVILGHVQLKRITAYTCHMAAYSLTADD